MTNDYIIELLREYEYQKTKKNEQQLKSILDNNELSEYQRHIESIGCIVDNKMLSDHELNILRLKYIDNETWLKVSELTMYSDSRAKAIGSNALKKIDNIVAAASKSNQEQKDIENNIRDSEGMLFKLKDIINTYNDAITKAVESSRTYINAIIQDIINNKDINNALAINEREQLKTDVNSLIDDICTQEEKKKYNKDIAAVYKVIEDISDFKFYECTGIKTDGTLEKKGAKINNLLYRLIAKLEFGTNYIEGEKQNMRERINRTLEDFSIF